MEVVGISYLAHDMEPVVQQGKREERCVVYSGEHRWQSDRTTNGFRAEGGANRKFKR